ncbi:alpha/beta fold hydrolase [Dictyobacter aurantiacus]|uniref:Alpha/beta hydrolase n=1 Tax=Dictyobacter aurantiacus TaxID=1936993 RepID=A0A401ZHE2_9CHLR|nr:alpha/beta fold hydrolase [Dictyobacter aurantiacus]GCE06305.1 alpha/beta hydrolase [Dictyobacter aurantiacus]
MASKASINSVELAYEDHGIGVPLIFLHAFPLNRHMWDNQLGRLLDEQRYRLVAPDWRGFGESSLYGNLSTMEMFADDLAGLMDHLGMQQAVLCGLSMGGYAAFAFLRKYPQRVGGLVLADTRPGADTEEGRANRENLARTAEQQGTDAIADLQIPRLLSEYTRTHHPAVEAQVRKMIATANPLGIAAASRGMALRADSSDLLGTINCPTLVLAGEHDALTPPDVARAYARQIKGARFAVIPHSGHLSNLEQPEAFQTVLQDFLRSAL